VITLSIYYIKLHEELRKGLIFRFMLPADGPCFGLSLPCLLFETETIIENAFVISEIKV